MPLTNGTSGAEIVDIKEKRQLAKKLGIKSWHNKKEVNLDREIAELQPINVDIKQSETIVKAVAKVETIKPKVDIIADKRAKELLASLGIKDDWLYSIANQYGFSKLEYIRKFMSFRCYLGDKCVDWVDLNDLSRLNGGGNVIKIPNKTRPVEKEKKVIKLKWRK